MCVLYIVYNCLLFIVQMCILFKVYIVVYVYCTFFISCCLYCHGTESCTSISPSVHLCSCVTIKRFDLIWFDLGGRAPQRTLFWVPLKCWALKLPSISWPASSKNMNDFHQLPALSPYKNTFIVEKTNTDNNDIEFFWDFFLSQQQASWNWSYLNILSPQLLHFLNVQKFP